MHEEKYILFKLIIAGEFTFDGPAWDNISEELKDLISHLLIVNPKHRITKDDILEHAWHNKKF
jgi:serine/threonine protein kinase